MPYCQARPDTGCCCGWESTEIGRNHAGLDLCHQPCDQSAHHALESVAQELAFTYVYLNVQMLDSKTAKSQPHVGQNSDASPCGPKDIEETPGATDTPVAFGLQRKHTVLFPK